MKKALLKKKTGLNHDLLVCNKRWHHADSPEKHKLNGMRKNGSLEQLDLIKHQLNAANVRGLVRVRINQGIGDIFIILHHE